MAFCRLILKQKGDPKMSYFQKVNKKIRDFLIYKIGFPILRTVEKLIINFSKVGGAAIFDKSQFDWSKKLEANWTVIRKELDDLMKYKDEMPNLQDITQDQASLTTDNKWKSYFFFAFGYKSEKNCQRCPNTTKLIESVPNMKMAYFSFLFPQKHIPRHRGAYKGLIRSHLPLIVPSPNTLLRMQVDKDVFNWEEGKIIIFDNTYYHEVWNDSDEVRVVLLMDVIRPLSFPFSILNKFIIHLMGLTSYIRYARKNQEAWENHFDKVVKHL
jgi:ornithine lipid ester-linked acyl 2-hydroxylase